MKVFYLVRFVFILVKELKVYMIRLSNLRKSNTDGQA